MSLNCEYCPKLCHHACPVADTTHDEALNTWGKVNTLRKIDQKILPESLENYQAAYQCVQCHASETACEINTPATGILRSYRQQAFQKGLAPSAIQDYVADFSKIRLHIDSAIVHGDVLFIPSYDHNNLSDLSFEKRLQKTFLLFESLNIKNVFLFESELPCCGYAYYAAGDQKSFLIHAKHQAKILRRFKTIVSDSPICLETFEKYYGEMGLTFKADFIHLNEFLSSKLPSWEKPSHKQETVAYHDPCYLGRHRGVYDAPRDILEKITGTPSVEFRRNRENSYCCGGGGLYPVTSPESADQMTLNRLQEFKETGAQTLVTSCSTCTQRFEAVNKKFKLKLKIFDFVDYLQK